VCCIFLLLFETDNEVTSLRPVEVNFLNLPSPFGHTQPDRNDYQKQKGNVGSVQCLGQTTLPPSVSRL
jgi:hypothetical protein